MQELCYSYADLLQPSAHRRVVLASAYFFDCTCQRCSTTGAADGDEATSSSSSGAEEQDAMLGGLACPAGKSRAVTERVKPSVKFGDLGRKQEWYWYGSAIRIQQISRKALKSP